MKYKRDDKVTMLSMEELAVYVDNELTKIVIAKIGGENLTIYHTGDDWYFAKHEEFPDQAFVVTDKMIKGYAEEQIIPIYGHRYKIKGHAYPITCKQVSEGSITFMGQHPGSASTKQYNISDIMHEVKDETVYKVGDKVLIKSVEELKELSTFNFNRDNILPIPDSVINMEEEALSTIKKIAGNLAVIKSKNGDLTYQVKVQEYPEWIFQIEEDYIQGYATFEEKFLSGAQRDSEDINMIRNTKKPPLGLIRLENWEINKDNERTLDILQAMLGYSQEEKPVPKEWVKELTGRVINLMDGTE